MTARVCFSLITALLCLSVYLSTTDAEGAATGEIFIFITQREEMDVNQSLYIKTTLGTSQNLWT